eukprot:TRINITY_DN16540_c0_g1_i1.p1 TRINITY_DN16540_c0_g1~~TRINITY_DN16540_c0_g1_i1.p1  ORF type:complete len:131 (+),score=21.20 TRINITY_DN16540_c0_g1_i1:73-465(+)
MMATKVFLALIALHVVRVACDDEAPADEAVPEVDPPEAVLWEGAPKKENATGLKIGLIITSSILGVILVGAAVKKASDRYKAVGVDEWFKGSNDENLHVSSVLQNLEREASRSALEPPAAGEYSAYCDSV